MTITKNLQDAYLQYVNDYITLEEYATDNSLTLNQARTIIGLGYQLQEEQIKCHI